jgi:hypothetical protein
VDVWLSFAGIVCQILGVTLTVVGLRQTWASHGTGPFPPFEWARRRRDRFVAWFNRMVLRRHQGVVVNLRGTSLAVASLRARARIGFGPLPPGTAKAQIAVLSQRMTDLSNSAFNKIDGLEDAVDEVRTELRGIDKKLDATAAHLEAQDHSVAVGGIVTESVGLVLIAVGLTLQGFALFIGIVADQTL